MRSVLRVGSLILIAITLILLTACDKKELDITSSFASIKSIENSDSISSDGAIDIYGCRYRVVSTVEENSLYGGVKHTKYIAESSFPTKANNDGTETVLNEYCPQNVNVLTIPSSKKVKIVTWTYTSNESPDKWTLATLTDLAKNFEENNPGFSVIAGTNGDFFDMSGNGKYGYMLYQTKGPAVTNGQVLKPINSQGYPIGFKNDGSKNSVVYNKDYKYSDFPYLTIYDSNKNIISEFEVKYLNEKPQGDQIAIYFNHTVSINKFNKVNVPANSYFAACASKMLGMDSKNVYAEGKTEFSNEEKTLENNQFAIYTQNSEAKKALDKAFEVRVQYKIVGDFKTCDNITAANQPLITNGIVMSSLNENRHPRTMLGYKEDGTVVLVTVDGRQSSNGMYGMTYMEMAVTMKYYGCYEAVNMDGGGSTTMIIKEGNDFRVLNSPSEKSLRKIANAIFVVYEN